MNIKKNAAFTLIELLVVVLIIGILSAIAFPQYTKAVERSRSAEALIVLRSVVEANKRYYLANGKYATSLEDLDVSIPWTAESSTVRSNGEWTLTLGPSNLKTNGSGALVSVLRRRGYYENQGFWYFFENDRYRRGVGPFCVETWCNTKNYCKKVMGLPNGERIGSWGSKCLFSM